MQGESVNHSNSYPTRPLNNKKPNGSTATVTIQFQCARRQKSGAQKEKAMEHMDLNLNVKEVEDDAGIRVTRVLHLPLSVCRRKIEEGLLFL